MDFVYSQSPWVLPKDPEGTEKIFSDHGWKVTFNDHEVIPFGLEKRVYFIRKGLFATLAGGAGDFSRMVGLFPAGTTLGAIRAISQPGNEMPLMAKALLPVEALALDIPLYLRELEKDPAFLSLTKTNFILKEEAQVEGLLMNGLLTVPKRLALIILSLFKAGNGIPGDAVTPLPGPITVTDLAALIHSNRGVVSRTLSGWAREGLISELNGRYAFTRQQLLFLAQKDHG